MEDLTNAWDNTLDFRAAKYPGQPLAVYKYILIYILIYFQYFSNYQPCPSYQMNG